MALVGQSSSSAQGFPCLQGSPSCPALSQSLINLLYSSNQTVTTQTGAALHLSQAHHTWGCSAFAPVHMQPKNSHLPPPCITAETPDPSLLPLGSILIRGWFEGKPRLHVLDCKFGLGKAVIGSDRANTARAALSHMLVGNLAQAAVLQAEGTAEGSQIWAGESQVAKSE